VASTIDLYSDSITEYVRHDQPAMIEMRWLKAARSMTEEEFREAIERLSALLERERVPNVLVDMSDLVYEPAPDFPQWRETRIIPRYNGAGVERFAFLLPPDAPGTVEMGAKPASEGAANFPTAYFSTRQRALAWLSGVGQPSAAKS
jgi:hypothetical protein